MPAVAEPQFTNQSRRNIEYGTSLVGRSRVRLEESGELVDSVESDLSGLAQSSERLREEKAMSERSPNEQTRKYALKLPELEIQA